MLVNSGYVVWHNNVLTYRHALFLLLLLASKKNKLNSRQRVICIDSACHKNVTHLHETSRMSAEFVFRCGPKCMGGVILPILVLLHL